MQKTNKVPAVEERTVSGSSVSFNSAFALPLKACKVSFSATQAGSGDPSPSNPRAISGVSGLNLSANSVPVSVNFGEERFGGELDVLTGILTITFKSILLDGSITPQAVNWKPQANSVGILWQNDIASDKKTFDASTLSTIMCDRLPTAKYRDLWADDVIGICPYSTDELSFVTRIPDTSVTTKPLAVQWLENNPLTVVYELAEPITIQLSANELFSILGNNTFSTDTGTLEITFSDLQEKSASGSVASFNTALAMPLVECKTEFMCTQASGTPSPSNPLAITGVDSVAIQRGGVNLFTRQNEQLYSYLIEDGSIYYYAGTPWTLSDFIPVIPNTTYHFNPNSTMGGTAKHGFFDVNKNFISAISSGEMTFTTPSNARYMRFSYRATSDNIQLEYGNTPTSYEPYISNTVTLIDLDGTRYGGYVDVVRKKLVVDRKYIKATDKNWVGYSYNEVYTSTDTDNSVTVQYPDGRRPIICNRYKYDSSAYLIPDNCCGWGGTTNNKNLFIRDSVNATSLDAWNAYIADNEVEFVYYIVPIEISLSDIPTLSTIIGNNSFASDSGSIDLTYKDLDIAKRGNFREVFRLPS